MKRVSKCTHGCSCCCTERSRVARTKVNSVGRIPGRLSPPLDYTRFVGARNRSSDRRRVKGSEEDEERKREREREESWSRREKVEKRRGWTHRAHWRDLLRRWEKGERGERRSFVLESDELQWKWSAHPRVYGTRIDTVTRVSISIDLSRPIETGGTVVPSMAAAAPRRRRKRVYWPLWWQRVPARSPASAPT